MSQAWEGAAMVRRDDEERTAARRRYASAGSGTLIPFILLACVAVGYLMGRGLDALFHTVVFVKIGVVLGVLAGILETVQMIKKLSRGSNHERE